MSKLAPGRTHDMAMLQARLASLPPHTRKWGICQRKIQDLVEEGKCATICHLRERLIGASKVNDHDVILQISEQITEHMKRKHYARFMRAWQEKG